MSQYTQAKTRANQLILTGIGGGCLLFLLGTFTKVSPLSVMGLMASAGSGGVGYVMRENSKRLRTDQEVYEEKREELEKFLNSAKQRANNYYRLDYFDLDRHRPDHVNFNAYEIILSDRNTKSTGFYFTEVEKIYNTRTRTEVDRVTKKKIYYKTWQETYVDKIVIAINYNNSVINARVTAIQFNRLVDEYNQLEKRRDSVANLEHEYNQLLATRPRTSNPSNSIANQPQPSGKRRELSEIDQGYQLSDKYEVIKKLGEGGFGATFIVKSLTTNITTQFVAKCQKLTGNVQQDQDLIQRFEREAIALQKVGDFHGQVPSLFDYFNFEGNFYLIQELVRGQTLMDVLLQSIQAGYVFSEKRAAELISSLLEILEHIHEQGLIHRDIKPQNIILREGDDKPVLIDFGLIKQLTEENYQQTGTASGTIGYCPLEQQLGKAFFQSDLYAVGMIMLVLTTGRPPHTLEFNDQFEPELDWAEEILSSSLLNWIEKAIQALPQNRFSSAREMRETLLTIINQDYVIRGAEIANEAYQEKMASMESELESLRKQLKSQPQNNQWQVENNPQIKRKMPSNLGQIITTQKELDAYNIIKRIITQGGYNESIIQLTDTVDYCDIHLSKKPENVLVRLYFNDESNLAFAIPDLDGTETNYSINTLRGIFSKKSAILNRLESLLSNNNPSDQPQQNSSNEPTEYTAEWLQENFESFNEAKDHFGVRVRSWQKLADKLNEES